MLAALYGADAVAPLVAAARGGPGGAAGELLESERERVLGVLDALGHPARPRAELLRPGGVVEEAR